MHTKADNREHRTSAHDGAPDSPPDVGGDHGGADDVAQLETAARVLNQLRSILRCLKDRVDEKPP